MSIKLSQVEGDLEIDVDIEKKITQLQEAKLAGEIERPEQLSIDPEKQLTEWHLEKGLKTFLANVEFEKEDLSKKIEQEDAKIKALEEMFGGRKTNPSRIYIPRCEHYLENPPGEDWDGVWTLTSK